MDNSLSLEDHVFTEEEIQAIIDASEGKAPINLTKGKYAIELCKREDGSYHGAIVLQIEDDGCTPIADFPIKAVRDDDYTFSFEFELK